MRYLNRFLVFIIVCGLIAAVVIAAIKVPQTTAYASIIAIGLALALQKYIASFFGYFVIMFTRIYEKGDRIRVGNVKGDVRSLGLLHTSLEEVGEDEKLGGEVTGRIVHLPNLVILDQPVLNYSKDYLSQGKKVQSDYIFDEVRIPISTDSDAEEALSMLDSIIKDQEKNYLDDACNTFQDDYPNFLKEAIAGPRVLIFVEPRQIWVKGKYVAPLKQRNQLRSDILLRFLKEAATKTNVKMA